MMNFNITGKPFALYNEIEPYAADWIENLIRAGVIAPGIVDRRSIEDLRGDDLRGFRQVHLFAGIAVWSYALRCAGVSDDTALWTGSCPCQPFSQAGQGAGMADERHLWPAFLHLIRECRPPKIYGEQVASKDGLGWLDTLQADLEGSDYACGALDTCSAGFGAPHIRQRLRFSAYDLRSATGGVADDNRDGQRAGWRLGLHRERQARSQPAHGVGIDGLADFFGEGLEGVDARRMGHEREALERGGEGEFDRLGDLSSGGFGERGNAAFPQCGRYLDGAVAFDRPGPTNGFWRDADWLFCRDGKWRPTQPGALPLVDGSAFNLGSGGAFEGKSRTGMLRAYGNAVDAEATREFIEVALEVETIDLEPIRGAAARSDFDDLF